MKKYISADLRVINISANDIIATSATTGYSAEGIDDASGMKVGGRRDMFDDNYENF